MAEFLAGIEFWHWWVLAAALVGIEMLMPTTVLLWPGAAAAIVGIVVLAVPGLDWQGQLLLFAALSVVTVVATRIYVHRRPLATDDTTLNRRAERYVGRQFTLEQPITGGQGTLHVDDTTWKIEGEDAAAGARVQVVAVEDAVLRVEAGAGDTE